MNAYKLTHRQPTLQMKRGSGGNIRGSQLGIFLQGVDEVRLGFFK